MYLFLPPCVLPDLPLFGDYVSKKGLKATGQTAVHAIDAKSVASELPSVAAGITGGLCTQKQQPSSQSQRTILFHPAAASIRLSCHQKQRRLRLFASLHCTNVLLFSGDSSLPTPRNNRSGHHPECDTHSLNECSSLQVLQSSLSSPDCSAPPHLLFLVAGHLSPSICRAGRSWSISKASNPLRLLAQWQTTKVNKRLQPPRSKSLQTSCQHPFSSHRPERRLLRRQRRRSLMDVWSD